MNNGLLLNNALKLNVYKGKNIGVTGSETQKFPNLRLMRVKFNSHEDKIKAPEN